MHKRIVTPHSPNVPSADDRNSFKHDALGRVRRAFNSIIDSLRAGYPDEAPRTGHSPLSALFGPLALTPSQKDRIAEDLGNVPADGRTIAIAITKSTKRLPTPGQTHAISRELNLRTSQDN